jgi:hypothetical protein
VAYVKASAEKLNMAHAGVGSKRLRSITNRSRAMMTALRLRKIEIQGFRSFGS